RHHRHILKTPRETRNALTYVLLNHQHHACQRGAGSMNVVDPFSSAPWFDGWSEPCERATSPPDMPSARTWLLAVGWRRRGLISPWELPASRSARRPPPAL